MQRWLWRSRTTDRWSYAKIDHEYVLYGSAMLEGAASYHPNEVFRLLAGGSGSHQWYREGWGPSLVASARRFIAKKESSKQWTQQAPSC